MREYATLTRRHIAVAIAIRNAVDGRRTDKEVKIGDFDCCIRTLASVVDDLADYFTGENLRFDREKFLKACGVE